MKNYPYVKSENPFVVVHKCSCGLIYEDTNNMTGGLCSDCDNVSLVDIGF